jgi:hypothetical protein
MIRYQETKSGHFRYIENHSIIPDNVLVIYYIR